MSLSTTMNERKATMNGTTVLRDLRMSRGWSLEDLAEKLDGAVSRQSLHKYENGDVTPSPSILTKIAHVFGVTPLELVTGPDCLVEIKAFRHTVQVRGATPDEREASGILLRRRAGTCRATIASTLVARRSSDRQSHDHHGGSSGSCDPARGR